jgi:hypothetical protein
MKTYREFMSEASKSPFVSSSVKKISSRLGAKSVTTKDFLPKKEPKSKQLNIKMPTTKSFIPKKAVTPKSIVGLSSQANASIKSKVKSIARKPLARIERQVTNAAKKTGASIGSSIAKKIGL